MANFLVTLPAVQFVEPFIRWHLITIDEEDNKFVDCAVSAGAACIISYDKHFEILKTTKFPVVPVFTAEEFALFCKQSDK